MFMTHLLFLFDIVVSRVGQEVELSQDSNRTPFQRLAAKRCLIYFFWLKILTQLISLSSPPLFACCLDY